MIKLKIVRREKRGITLIETMFYLAVLGMVLNLGTHYLFQTRKLYRNQQKYLNQSIETILAGRKIKQNIEKSKSTEDSYESFSAGKNHLIIKKSGSVIIYRLDKGNLSCLSIKSGDVQNSRIALKGVKSFSFQRKSEGGIPFIEINIKLEKISKKKRVEPIFTFKAIPGVAYDEEK